MFLARRGEDGRRGAAAMTGEVTVPGGVWMEGERRGAAVYAPGGYHWVPARGERVLVLKAGESGEEPCVMGRVPEERGLRRRSGGLVRGSGRYGGLCGGDPEGRTLYH